VQRPHQVAGEFSAAHGSRIKVNALVLMMALRLAGGSLALGGQRSPAVSGPAGRPPPAASAPARVSPARLPARLQAIHWLPQGFRLRRAKALPPPHDETIRYDIRYGVLGSIGSLRVSAGALVAGGAQTVRLQGAGSGSVLGLGAMQSQLDAEFDTGLRGSRRWTYARGEAGAQTVDSGSWDAAGQAHLVRRKPGQPDEAYHFPAPLQTSDPLGLIWRLRMAPPPLGASDTLQVVDGLATWRVHVTTVAVADLVPESAPGTTALRLEGEVTPFFYDGRPDPDRKTRHFTLWLDHSPTHLPLRIAVPLGPANLVIRLNP